MNLRLLGLDWLGRSTKKASHKACTLGCWTSWRCEVLRTGSPAAFETCSSRGRRLSGGVASIYMLASSEVNIEIAYLLGGAASTTDFRRV